MLATFVNRLTMHATFVNRLKIYATFFNRLLMDATFVNRLIICTVESPGAASLPPTALPPTIWSTWRTSAPGQTSGLSTERFNNSE